MIFFSFHHNSEHKFISLHENFSNKALGCSPGREGNRGVESPVHMKGEGKFGALVSIRGWGLSSCAYGGGGCWSSYSLSANRLPTPHLRLGLNFS